MVRLVTLGSALMVALAGAAGAARGGERDECIRPGLPLVDTPSPEILRAGRRQLDAWLVCIAPRIDRLRAAAAVSDAAASERDAALAEVDRITGQWQRYEERARSRRR